MADFQNILPGAIGLPRGSNLYVWNPHIICSNSAGPSTAGTKLPPSDDPKRTKKKRQPRISDWLKDRGHENPPTEPTKDKRERDPEVTDQDDDPNQIDDVV